MSLSAKNLKKVLSFFIFLLLVGRVNSSAALIDNSTNPILNSLVSRPSTNLTAPKLPDRQRYLAIMVFGYEEDPNVDDERIQNAAIQGCNAVEMSVHWDKVYPTRSSAPQWQVFDSHVRTALKYGLKIGIRIHTARDPKYLNGFYTQKEAMQAADSSRSNTGGGVQFSLASQPTIEMVKDFVRQVVQRYQYLQQQDNLLFMSVVTSPIQEGEYSQVNTVAGGGYDYVVPYDYGGYMKQAFREWLQSQFSLSSLNQRWGTDFNSWAAVIPPGWWSGEPFDAFGYGKRGLDWYVFRHTMLKRFLDQMSQTIKSVNGSIKVVNQHGSTYDGRSGLRGTYAFKTLAQNADGVKINDSPGYNHRFGMDLLRSNLPTGAILSNEVDGLFIGYGMPFGDFYRQITDSFDHGCTVITLCNFGGSNARGTLNQLIQRTVADGYLRNPIPQIQPSGTITYKLSSMVRSSLDNADSRVQERWSQLYAQNGNKPIQVILNEDLLNETTNQSPRVNQPISNQTAYVGQSFSYSVPSSTFADPDGYITNIEITGGLPAQGLSANGTTVSGTPNSAGTITVTVKATDNNNAFTTTQFQIVVQGQSPTPNQSPVVAQAIGDQSGTVGQSFSYSIPGATFSDSDGKIASVEVNGLPGGLSYNSSNQTISGTPTSAATSTITVKATDDKGATVSTSFKLTVNQPNNSNKGPVVAQSIPDQTVQVGQSFSYTIPQGTFTDADGQIASIDVSNLPSGLSYNSGNRVISGTPNTTGSVIITVKATDDKGASVSTSFTLKITSSSSTQLTLIEPLFNCTTGQITFRTSGGDGSTIEYKAVGIVNSWSTTAVYTVDAWLRQGTTFDILARQNGNEVKYTYTTPCNGSTLIVNQPIDDQTGIVGQAFSFTIPANTFKSSGTIINTDVSDLPSGLSYNSTSRTISGTPRVASVTTITVTAVDDKGALAKTSFKLTITATGTPPTTTPPTSSTLVVSNPIGDQAAVVGQSFSFAIPANTFQTSGTLSSVSVSSLPAGLSYNATNRTISGTPTQAGTTTITVTAKDDKNATASTSFKLTVTNPVTTTPTDKPICDAGPEIRSLTVNSASQLTVSFHGQNVQTIDWKIWQGQTLTRSGNTGQLTSSTFVVSLNPALAAGTYTLTLDGGACQAKNPAATQQGFTITTSTTTTPPTTTPPVTSTLVVSNAIGDQSAVVGQSFSFAIPANTFQTSGTLTNVDVSSLPAGLSYNSTSRTISGMPTQASVTTITVTAQDDKGNTAKTSFKLTITAPTTTTPPTSATLVVSNPIGDQAAVVGQAYSFALPANTFQTSGTLTNVSVSSLPAGLSYNATNRTISGTPTQAGTTTITVTAKDDKNATASTSFKLTVTNPVTTTPTDKPICDAGPEIRSLTVNSASQLTVSFHGQNVQTIDWKIWQGQTLTRSGNTGQLTSSTFVVSLNPALAAGTYTLALDGGACQAKNPAATQQGFTITSSPTTTPPTTTPPVTSTLVVSNPIGDQAAVVGQSYSFAIPANTFQTSGTLTNVDVSDLPAGLDYDSKARTILGTPKLVGVTTITVTAQDDKGNLVKTSFKLTITAPTTTTPPTSSTLVVSNAIGDQTAVVGQSFSFAIPANTFQTSGALTNVDVSSLPAGLSYNASNRTISGTPTQAGTTTITVTAKDDKNATASTSFKLTVTNPVTTTPTDKPICDAGPEIRSLTVNSASQLTVSFHGQNVQTIDWKIWQGQTLTRSGNTGQLTSSTFVVSLNPALAAGTYTLALDGGACQAKNPAATQQGFTITTSTTTTPPTTTPPATSTLVVSNAIGDQSAVVGQSFSFALPANTFQTSGTLTNVDVSDLPAGLDFDSKTRTILGTPSLIGVTTITVTAQDDKGNTAKTSFKLTITAPTTTTPPTSVALVVSNPIGDQAAVVGQAYSFALPANTFQTSGTLTNVSVSSLPAGLSYNATNRTISGTPTQASTTTITVTAKDDKNATASTSFKLTITAPVATTPPASTITAPTNGTVLTILAPDYDCQSGQLTIRTSGGDGSPILYGVSGIFGWNSNPTFTLSSDLRNGSRLVLIVRQGALELPYTYVTACSTTTPITSPSTGTITTPATSTTTSPAASPVIKYIADQEIFEGETYSYTFPDAGSGSQLDISGLPSGLSLNAATRTVSGTTFQSGVYPVLMKTTDGQGTVSYVGFKLTVKDIALTLQLIKADGTNQSIQAITDNSSVDISKLPAKVNLVCSATGPVASLSLILTGPQTKKQIDNQAPYAFDEGFTPTEGTYLLQAVAYSGPNGTGNQISSQNFLFRFTKTGSTGRVAILADANAETTGEQWRVFPNPVRDVINLTLPASSSDATADHHFALTSTNGKQWVVNPSAVRWEQGKAVIDVSQLQLPIGVYFLQVGNAEHIEKVLKIVKE